jgi:hypothetical protein
MRAALFFVIFYSSTTVSIPVHVFIFLCEGYSTKSKPSWSWHQK